MVKKERSFSLYVLPGFLGMASDYRFLARFSEGSIKEIIASDILKHVEEKSMQGLWSFARKYNQWIERRHGEKRHGRILLGYSMGGRLALHVLIDNPSLWSGAIIVSAHSGLQTERERELRRDEDKLWAKKFISSANSWEELMKEWHDRPIFGGKDPPFLRREKDFSRRALGLALEKFSLGVQEDLRPLLACVPVPILWVIGREDLPACIRKDELHFAHPSSRTVVIENAGHRLLWEQESLFFEEMDRFLKGDEACAVRMHVGNL